MKLKKTYIIMNNAKENETVAAYCFDNKNAELFIEIILNGDLKHYHKITDTNQKEEINYFLKHAEAYEINQLKMELNIANF